MNIVVTDDSTDKARQLAGYISTYFMDVHTCQQTTVFDTATDFLHLWHRNAFDLIFMDIFLKGEASGIRVAECIRKDDDQCALIFTTSSTDFVLKRYEVRTLGYAVKSLRYGRFSQIMDYFRSVSQRKRSYYIEVKESRIMIKLPIDDILCTGYSNHYIQIHLEDKTARIYMRLHDLSSLLLHYLQFICCYRNRIINMDKVSVLKKTELVLTTGEQLPIARNLRSQIHQQYVNYQSSKLNGGIRWFLSIFSWFARSWPRFYL